MRQISSAALSLAGLLITVGGAQAQFTPISVGQTVNGALAASDPRLSERGALKVYQFRAEQGQRVVANLRSTDFDAYLTVARTVAGLTDYLKSDDDHGGDTNARLRFVVPAEGTYLLIAQSLQQDGAGSYTLTLEPAAAPTTADRRTLRVGETVSGSLAETDAIVEEDETFYDTYVIQGRQGQRLTIDMRSDAFDSFLAVGTETAGEFEPADSDDDGGGELNSRVMYTVPADGPVVIRANTIGAGSTGAYTLVVTERPPRRANATARPITAGQETEGELSLDDAQLDDDSYFDLWTYTGTPGETIKVKMTSDAFDTFLAAGQMAGGVFQEDITNDDGPGDSGTNSEVDFIVPASGTVTIRTNSLSGEQTGAYRVLVERVR